MTYLIIAIALLALTSTVWIVRWFKVLAANADAEIAANIVDMERYGERIEAVVALPMEEARRRAELLLADPDVFASVESPASQLPDVLAPALRGLFSRFESVTAVQDEAFLSRNLVAPFGWEWEDGPWRRHQFWQIGWESGHVYTLVKPYEEGVYNIEELEDDDDVSEPDFPSVYHWLLAVAPEQDS